VCFSDYVTWLFSFFDLQEEEQGMDLQASRITVHDDFDLDLDLDAPIFSPETRAEEEYPTGGCPTISIQCTNGGSCTTGDCC
jgi:hypothetical protein